MICFSPELWKQEIQHLKQIFHEKNVYPKGVINQVVEQVEAKHRTVIHSNKMDDFEPFTTNRRVAEWLAIYARKPKVLGLSPTDSYFQR